MRHIATSCGQCNCGCPDLHVDDDAAPERRVVITDDFGQRIQMSVGQLADLVADVRSGVLDAVVATAGQPDAAASAWSVLDVARARTRGSWCDVGDRLARVRIL